MDLFDYTHPLYQERFQAELLVSGFHSITVAGEKPRYFASSD